MNNKIACGIFFAFGGILGAAGGYVYAKKKYEAIANEEINEVKEKFSEELNKVNDKVTVVKEAMAEREEEPKKYDSPVEYAKANNIISDEDADIMEDERKQEFEDSLREWEEQEDILEEAEEFVKHPSPQVNNVFKQYSGGTGMPKFNEQPYVIKPEEFGDIEGYNLISLTLTKDGYLIDDQNELIDSPDILIGDSLASMGEYEDDSVHVRNDTRMCDYEILQDLRTYDEILNG